MRAWASSARGKRGDLKRGINRWRKDTADADNALNAAFDLSLVKGNA
jgi:hypothetical protein